MKMCISAIAAVTLVFSLLCGDGLAQTMPGPIGTVNASKINGITPAPVATQVTSEVLRSPNANDDSAHGYSVGDYWKDQNGNLWQNAVNTVGGAVWTPIGLSSPYLCDVVGGCYTASGVTQLVSSYSGNAFDVLRSDTATYSVAFVNGVPDWKNGDAFCNQGTLTCVITNYDNQTAAGHTHDCTPRIAGAYPPYPQQQPGGMRAWNFNGNYRLQQNATVGAECTDANASLSSQASSMFIVGRSQNTGNTMVNVQMGGTGGAQLLWYQGTSTPGLNASGNGSVSFSNLTGLLRTTPDIYGFTAGTGNTIFYTGNKSQGAAAFTSTTWTNLTLGSQPAAETSHFFMAADVYAFMTFNSALSTTQVANLQKAAYGTFPIYPQFREFMVNVGTSLSGSWGDSQGQGWVNQLLAMSSKPYGQLNVAVGGSTCTSLSTSVAAKNAAAAGYNNIITLECGSNDAVAGHTAAQTYGDLQATIANIRLSDSVDPIFVGNMIDRQNGTYETFRQSYNGLIAASIATSSGGTASATSIGTGPIYLVNVGGVAPLGISGNSTSTTYFQTDQTHLSAAGNNVYANMFYAAETKYGYPH